MAVDQLPGEMREFVNYLNALLARLDQGAGWCAVFWQRDPDGMQACLDGREVPPWDVLEAVLGDLAAAHGADAAAREAERVRPLHAAALAAHDARPGGRDALGDRLDVMLREQRYAAERLAELGRRLTSAATHEQADAVRLDLAWAHDDHERATARCAELRRRMADLDRLPPRRTTPATAHDARNGHPATQPSAAPAPAAGAGHDARGGGPGHDVREQGAAQALTGPAVNVFGVEITTGAGPGMPRRSAGGAGHETPTARGAGEPAQDAFGAAPGHPARQPVARGDGDGRGGYGAAGPAESADSVFSTDSVFSGFSGQSLDSGESGARSSGPGPASRPASADAAPAAPAAKQRKRRRGSARFAGMAEEEDAAGVVAPPAAEPAAPAPARRTLRGARFAGAAAERAEPPAEPQREPLDATARKETVEAAQRLVRLRAEGRSGEAHALLVELAHWPAARIPLLAAELQRAGLTADWTTLLWEAASLPADRLVAAADALVAVGRTADGEQLLRQGVARPAAEIGQAVIGLVGDDRGREARALLDAYVRVRSPEEAARSAAPDPQTLVPLLLSAARTVSEERHWDLVHAFRVAGFTA